MEEIIILDKFLAAEFRPRRRTVLIRIFSTDTFLALSYPRIKYFKHFEKVFCYRFDDVTPKDIEDELRAGGNPEWVLFSEEDASKIITDFERVYRNTDCLVVHCKAGGSRAHALAGALNHSFNLGIKDENYLNRSYCNPNMHVYSTFVRTAREKFGMNFRALWLGG